MPFEKNGKNVEICAVPSSDSLAQKKSNPKKFWHIDKEMLRFKIHYFLFCGAFGTCLPYLTIFAQKRVGISSSALAAILTTQRWLCIFTKPAIGYVTDYFNNMKVVIYILFTVGTVFFLTLLVVPKIDRGTDSDNLYKLFNISEGYEASEIHLSNSSLTIKIIINESSCFESLQFLSEFLIQSSRNDKNGCEISGDKTVGGATFDQNIIALSQPNSSFFCNIRCDFPKECQTTDCKDRQARITAISREKNTRSDFQTYQFWLYGFLSTVCTALGNSAFTLTDTACCETVQQTGAEFGRQCLWGSISWGLMSPISGLLNDYTGDFVASWILMALLSFVSLLNMTRLQMATPQFSQNLLKDVKTVLASREFLLFKFCVLMNGVGIGMVWFYLPLFLTDLGGSRFLFGMVMFVQCFCSEIPLMFFSGWIIRRIGHFNVLTLSLVAFTARFFWYSQLQNPWLALPAEALHGFVEGLLISNVASFAKLSSKPGTEATTQGVLFTAHEGLGVGIGCIITGLGFDSIGGHRTFLYASIYSGGATVLSVIVHLLIRKQTRSIAVTTSDA